MMSLRTAIRSPALQRVVVARALSSQAVSAVEKLKCVLEEYRQANYTQEIPTRFKKDIIKAAASNNTVAQTGLERVLHNIGASHSISQQEIRSIFSEVGDANGEIPSHKLVQLL